MKREIIFEKWSGNSMLQMVKRIKEFSNMGLKDSKDWFDDMDSKFRNNIPVIVIEDSLEYHMLVMLKSEGFISFKFAVDETKKENHRVIAKRSKEYEKAKAWVDSLHPKKQAMIKLLINEGNER